MTCLSTCVILDCFQKLLVILLLYSHVNSYNLPGSCGSSKFYDPSLMDCLSCPANASLATSADGFSCTCEGHSIPIGISRCKPCNTTEVVSSDGTSCVPRRCQVTAGRFACRKCPRDYISVTQNFDGSPMKEVQCIKCARGYKALDNRCIKCVACTCSKHEVVVKGTCVPKKYILDRPKYVENQLHPDELLEMVKLEYLCTRRDYKACRSLASACARNFYTSDPAGPCRLWIQNNLVKFEGLPFLTLEASNNANVGISLDERKDVKVIMTIHTNNGGLKFITDETENRKSACLPPIEIKIGYNYARDCLINVTELSESAFKDIFELYLPGTDLEPLSIIIRKPNGYYVQKTKWPSQHFRKFFLVNKFLSTTSNTTNTVYLRTLLFRISIQRNSSLSGSLQLQLSVEGHYDTMSPLTDVITTSLVVEHEMPTAGMLRGLEICGGIFCLLMTLYALLQWRSVYKRGGVLVALVPILASSIADALYFATLFSSLHSFAAEAGTLSLRLPLSDAEERVVEAIVYSVVCLKALNVLWFNWKQCRCDIFFVDWSKYNPPPQDIQIQKTSNWKEVLLASEWTSLQTKRKVSPGFTATSTLFVLYLLEPWQSKMNGAGYRWVTASAVWWTSYTAFFCLRLLINKLTEIPASRLIKLCSDLELSLLVFEEEYYAHYVDGRTEDLMDFRSSAHFLKTCRILCSTELRKVYNKLSINDYSGGAVSNRVLLSQFLAAFFERALDGLNWVASERTLFEKLLNVELVVREGGTTSILLYGGDVTSYSCLDVTWWGKEWILATFDSMIFGYVLMITNKPVLAAIITLTIWKIMKITRAGVSYLNIRNKIGNL